MHPTTACHERLTDLAFVLSQLSNDEYSSILPVLNQSSLSGHTRHVIEFYQCLINQHLTGHVNYDLRQRNVSIEQSVSKAIEQIIALQQDLSAIDEDCQLTLEASFCYDSDETCRIQTTLFRELVYQLEHTVHHMALLRVGITHAYPQVELPATFGIAASTLRYSLDLANK